jgi:hypothetical protein
MSIDVNVQNDLVIVTESSEDITVNVSNAAGPAGVGVPTGGTTGQVLKKLSNTNYDTYWALDGGGVPYSGATGDVNLGTHRILAQNATIASSGSGDTFTLNHTSGSGIGLNITKGGSGEGLYINKTSGSGNAATIVGTLNATTLVKSGGTSSQFLKADGSVDSSTYVGGSGASGQVAYWNGTSSQTGSNNLFWDAANSRLGINTTSPIRALDIRGAARIETASTTELDLIGGGGNILRVSCSATTPFIGTMTSNPLGFFIGATERARFFTTGNFGINTGATDGGQRLQVQGDAFIKGSGATSATNALVVQDSAGTQILNVRNDGNVFVGLSNSNLRFTNNGGGTNRKIIQATWSDGVCRGTDLYTNSSGDTSAGNGYGLAIYNPFNTTFTSGEFDTLVLYSTFSPTSGTGRYTHLNIRPAINQTGGANGITRGLYVNPTLTAAADWRSIEWSNNSGWGLYGAGTAPNYLNGSLGIGSTSLTVVNFRNQKPISGGVTSYANLTDGIVQQAVTSNAFYYATEVATVNIAFTLPNLYHYRSAQGTFGASSTVTNQFGFYVDSSLISATNNYGFYGGIPNGTNRWNLYMNGTADNYLAGKLVIGTTTVSTFALDVNGTARVSGATTLAGVVAVNSTNVSTGYALFVNGVIGAGILTLTDELTVGENFAIKNNGSQTIDIDANNNSTNAIFRVTCNGTNNELFRVNESGNFMLGTSTEIASAKLVVTSTTQGFLPPRMTTTQKNAIGTPAAGLVVYDTDTNKLCCYNGTTWNDLF